MLQLILLSRFIYYHLDTMHYASKNRQDITSKKKCSQKKNRGIENLGIENPGIENPGIEKEGIEKLGHMFHTELKISSCVR